MSIGHYVNLPSTASWQARGMPKKKSAAKTSGDPRLKEFGARFRRVRKALQLTQGEMARELGVHQSAISRLENAERGLRTPEFVELLEAAARKRLIDGFLVTGTGDPVRLASDTEAGLRELRARIERVEANQLSEQDRRPRQLPPAKRRSDQP